MPLGEEDDAGKRYQDLVGRYVLCTSGNVQLTSWFQLVHETDPIDDPTGKCREVALNIFESLDGTKAKGRVLATVGPAPLFS